MRSIIDESPFRNFGCDFRNSLWGMTKGEVKLSEKVYPLSESETHITYKDTVMCLEAIVGFHFVDNSLIEAGYAFHEASLDRDLYIWEYERVKLVLTQMYGEPMIDKNISNRCEKEVSAVESFSEENSHMFIAEWLNSRSIIRLVLVSDKSSLEFGVLHLRKEHGSAYNMPKSCATHLKK